MSVFGVGVTADLYVASQRHRLFSDPVGEIEIAVGGVRTERFARRRAVKSAAAVAPAVQPQAVVLADVQVARHTFRPPFIQNPVYDRVVRHAELHPVPRVPPAVFGAALAVLLKREIFGMRIKKTLVPFEKRMTKLPIPPFHEKLHPLRPDPEILFHAPRFLGRLIHRLGQIFVAARSLGVAQIARRRRADTSHHERRNIAPLPFLRHFDRRGRLKYDTFVSRRNPFDAENLFKKSVDREKRSRPSGRLRIGARIIAPEINLISHSLTI